MKQLTYEKKYSREITLMGVEFMYYRVGEI